MSKKFTEKLTSFFHSDKRLQDVLDTCYFFGSYGIHKRLDENRELMQLIFNQAPEFLEKFPWIEGWLQTQDAFFLAIIDALQVPHPYAGTTADNGKFPRPWPKKAIAKGTGEQ